MTHFTVGEHVCRQSGDRKDGTIIAIIIPLNGKPDKVRVMTRQGEIYEEAAKKMVYCDCKRKAGGEDAV